MSNWTEEQYAAFQRDRGATTFAEAKQAQPKPMRAHKFGARACIITADFTLFTAADIQRASEHLILKPRTSLRQRAEAAGIHGDWFGSEKEGKRWIKLNRLQLAGQIMGLRKQIDFDLTAHGVRICGWRADFCYDERQFDRSWLSITEDCKGFRTAEYQLKKKLFEAERRVTIRET